MTLIPPNNIEGALAFLHFCFKEIDYEEVADRTLLSKNEKKYLIEKSKGNISKISVVFSSFMSAHKAARELDQKYNLKQTELNGIYGKPGNLTFLIKDLYETQQKLLNKEKIPKEEIVEENKITPPKEQVALVETSFNQNEILFSEEELVTFFKENSLIVRYTSYIPIGKIKTLTEDHRGFVFDTKSEADNALQCFKKKYPTILVSQNNGQTIRIPVQFFKKEEQKKAEPATLSEKSPHEVITENTEKPKSGEDYILEGISILKEEMSKKAATIKESELCEKNYIISKNFKNFSIPEKIIQELLKDGKLIIPIEIALKYITTN